MSDDYEDDRRARRDGRASGRSFDGGQYNDTYRGRMRDDDHYRGRRRDDDPYGRSRDDDPYRERRRDDDTNGRRRDDNKYSRGGRDDNNYSRSGRGDNDYSKRRRDDDMYSTRGRESSRTATAAPSPDYSRDRRRDGPSPGSGRKNVGRSQRDPLSRQSPPHRSPARSRNIYDDYDDDDNDNEDIYVAEMQGLGRLGKGELQKRVRVLGNRFKSVEQRNGKLKSKVMK